jgi:PAS domain S-box-containing protein
MERAKLRSRKDKPGAAGKDGFSTPVRVLILSMVGAAAIGVVVRFGEISKWNGTDILGLAALALATSITEQFPLEMRHRTETLYLALTDSMWAAGLVLARPGVLTMAVVIGVYVGLMIRKLPPDKIAFNLGQYVLSITVAEVVFSALAGSASMAFKLLVAVPVAMAAYAVVSAFLVGLVISLAERKSLGDILLPPLAVNALHYAGNIALGILGAMAWQISPPGVLLVGFPLALLYAAYRIMVRNLREGDRLRELIVENASDGIFVSAPDCSIVSWNPAMERITGQAADEVIGKNWRSILTSSGSAEPLRGGTAPCQAPGDAWFAPIVRKDGTEGWILCSSSTVNGRDGKVKATVIVVHDISAEREAEQLKADFIATISHELRTPLTPLKGFLSSLIHGTIDDESDARHEYYRIMLRQANRLERLVTDLLEVSKIESTSALGMMAPVDLCAPVVEQIRTFSEENPARSIALSAPDSQVFVEADRSRVGLVVSNLLANALKYSPPDKRVQVVIAVEEDRATVSVRDEGPGIPLSEQQRIFDRFYQMEGHLTRPNGGVGLGLYICRRFVEGMHGRLWVDSRPGHGSTFSFSLPLAQVRSLTVSS